MTHKNDERQQHVALGTRTIVGIPQLQATFETTGDCDVCNRVASYLTRDPARAQLAREKGRHVCHHNGRFFVHPTQYDPPTTGDSNQ